MSTIETSMTTIQPGLEKAANLPVQNLTENEALRAWAQAIFKKDKSNVSPQQVSPEWESALKSVHSKVYTNMREGMMSGFVAKNLADTLIRANSEKPDGVEDLIAFQKGLAANVKLIAESDSTDNTQPDKIRLKEIFDNAYKKTKSEVFSAQVAAGEDLSVPTPAKDTNLPDPYFYESQTTESIIPNHPPKVSVLGEEVALIPQEPNIISQAEGDQMNQQLNNSVLKVPDASAIAKPQIIPNDDSNKPISEGNIHDKSAGELSSLRDGILNAFDHRISKLRKTAEENTETNNMDSTPIEIDMDIAQAEASKPDQALTEQRINDARMALEQQQLRDVRAKIISIIGHNPFPRDEERSFKDIELTPVEQPKAPNFIERLRQLPESTKRYISTGVAVGSLALSSWIVSIKGFFNPPQQEIANIPNSARVSERNKRATSVAVKIGDLEKPVEVLQSPKINIIPTHKEGLLAQNDISPEQPVIQEAVEFSPWVVGGVDLNEKLIIKGTDFEMDMNKYEGQVYIPTSSDMVTLANSMIEEEEKYPGIQAVFSTDSFKNDVVVVLHAGVGNYPGVNLTSTDLEEGEKIMINGKDFEIKKVNHIAPDQYDNSQMSLESSDAKDSFKGHPFVNDATFFSLEKLGLKSNPRGSITIITCDGEYVWNEKLQKYEWSERLVLQLVPVSNQDNNLASNPQN